MCDLPDKIIRFDALRIEKGMKKLCQCFEPNYMIDTSNHIVRCTKCNAIVDPFEALCNIALHYSILEDQTEYLLEQRRKIANYKPKKMVIKKLEEHYKEKMEPTCPHCGEAFHLDELLGCSWTNAKFVKYIKQEV